MSIASNPVPRGRLAPSPTGALHLGNARSLLLAWLSIRSRSGEIILRIEDLDHPKVKPEYTQQLFDDLRWLGLDWDGDPFIQSQRKSLYADAIEILKSKNLIYPCICSRKDVESAASAPHAEDEHERAYTGVCRERFKSYSEALHAIEHNATTPPFGHPFASEGEVSSEGGILSEDFEHSTVPFSTPPLSPSPPSSPSLAKGCPKGGVVDNLKSKIQNLKFPAWRFRTDGSSVTFTDLFCGTHTATPTDFVLSRSEDGAGYALAVVVDDAAMGITEVLRGDDLLPATPRQILLYRALDLPQPDFVHVPLVVAEDGRRLAKRHGDTRLSTLRALGHSPETITGLLAHWCGWADFGAHIHPRELLQRFSQQTLNPQPAVLDEKVKKLLRI